MRLILFLLICVSSVSTFKSKNPLKTKKYKCVEVADDMEIQVVSKMKYSWKPEDEELRPIGSAKIEPLALPPPEEVVEMPKAKKVGSQITAPPQVKQIIHDIPRDIPRDKEGRALQLSPEHCKQVKHYASVYGVTDVISWVERNCTFAKMWLPKATCEEINTLVGSCYKRKLL